MPLEFLNLTEHKISKDFFENIFEKILQNNSVISKLKDRFENKENISLELVLIGQGRMRNINKRYGSKNQITDVLTFPFFEIQKPTKKGLKFIEPKETQKNLGEVLLCPSRIKKRERKFKKDFKEELASAFIHGVLHLFDYEHKDTMTTKEMRKIEKEILTSIFEKNKIKERSFSLIELMQAIGILMILAAIVVVSARGARSGGRDSIRIKDLDTVANALDNYYNREGRYPYSLGPACTNPGTCWPPMCNVLILAGFLGECPQDPLYDPMNPASPRYEYCVDLQASQGTKYALMAKLETKSKALKADYDRDWPEQCPAGGCPAAQPNRCCKCNSQVGACNGGSANIDPEISPPYTYCVRNP